MRPSTLKYARMGGSEQRIRRFQSDIAQCGRRSLTPPSTSSKNSTAREVTVPRCPTDGKILSRHLVSYAISPRALTPHFPVMIEVLHTHNEDPCIERRDLILDLPDRMSPRADRVVLG